MIWVAEFTVNDVAGTPAKVTVVAPVNTIPVSVTPVPPGSNRAVAQSSSVRRSRTTPRPTARPRQPQPARPYDTPSALTPYDWVHTLAIQSGGLFDLMVTVPVRYEGLYTQTHIYMYCTDAMGIAAGRELFGYTKKEGDYRGLGEFWRTEESWPAPEATCRGC
ncbi:acetoacetate decarboxylase family protein [Streptomyces sp. NPDC050428]|uniref:acetoacetate decarboxylase family protein n=1 Tax=Streptomyces sp. NPDC050428 TaxID=3155757 RepID=UPI00343BCC8C